MTSRWRGERSATLATVSWIECVGEVGDGMTAVSAIDEQQPDLVFLDIHMPRREDHDEHEETLADSS